MEAEDPWDFGTVKRAVPDKGRLPVLPRAQVKLPPPPPMEATVTKPVEVKPPQAAGDYIETILKPTIREFNNSIPAAQLVAVWNSLKDMESVFDS